jgi:hypothetical protein
MKKIKLLLSAVLGTSISSILAAYALASGPGRQLDIQANFGRQVIDLQESDLIGISWDARCANVQYTLNTSLTANQGSQLEIPLEEVREIFNQGFKQWNSIRSSFINMRIVASVDLGDRPRQAFDFINEVTFTTEDGFGALASSPSSSLQEDATFVAGEDLDGDGDPDVFDPAQVGINTCTDIDQDGDIEWPAGDYKAGTIIDNDIQFNREVMWETEPQNTEQSNASVDLLAVAVHEFGHSHGLAHSAVNQTSRTDGDGATMFPFIDPDDHVSELQTRRLHTDDISASAFIYPEGSAQTGIAALQRGDIDFTRRFDVLKGSVVNGQTNDPIVGAVVQAVDSFGRVISSTISGEARVEIVEEEGFGVFDSFVFEEVVPVNGDFVLPVPKNRNYAVKITPLDGRPVAPARVSETARAISGTPLFTEEFYNGKREAAIEPDPSDAVRVRSSTRRAQSIDFLIGENRRFRNAGFFTDGDAQQNLLLPFVENAKFATYAERFDGQEVLDSLSRGSRLASTIFSTTSEDPSVVSNFRSVDLTLGKVSDDGTVNISMTIDRQFFVTANQEDATPVTYSRQARVNRIITQALQRDAELDVFVVINTLPYREGPSGVPNQIIGVDRLTGTNSSFLSINNGPLEPFNAGTFDIALDLFFDPES